MQVNLQNDGPVTIPLEAVPAVVSLFYNAITLTLHLLSFQNYLADTCQQCLLGMWNSGCHKIWCSYVWHMYMLRQSCIDGQGGFEDIHVHVETILHWWPRRVWRYTCTCWDNLTLMAKEGLKIYMYMLRQSYIDGQGGFEDIHVHVETILHWWPRRVWRYTCTCWDNLTLMAKEGLKIYMYMLRQSYIDGQGGFEDIHVHVETILHWWPRRVWRYTCTCWDNLTLMAKEGLKIYIHMDVLLQSLSGFYRNLLGAGRKFDFFCIGT